MEREMSKFLEYLFLQESIEDKGIFKACFMAGAPASGKSYTIQKIKSGQIDPRIVNTDKFTEHFKAYGSEKWSMQKDKIKMLTKNQLIQYLNSLLPLWIDGTSSSPPSVFRREGILKSLGYDTSIIWVDVPLELSLERAKKRERPVPEDVIIDIYNKIQDLKPYYKSHFGTFLEIQGTADLDEQVILKAFNKMSSWFLSVIQNPIGKSLYNEMRENKWKYLTDHDKYDMNYLKRLVDTWYKR